VRTLRAAGNDLPVRDRHGPKHNVLNAYYPPRFSLLTELRRATPDNFLLLQRNVTAARGSAPNAPNPEDLPNHGAAPRLAAGRQAPFLLGTARPIPRRDDSPARNVSVSASLLSRPTPPASRPEPCPTLLARQIQRIAPNGHGLVRSNAALAARPRATGRFASTNPEIQPRGFNRPEHGASSTFRVVQLPRPPPTPRATVPAGRARAVHRNQASGRRAKRPSRPRNASMKSRQPRSSAPPGSLLRTRARRCAPRRAPSEETRRHADEGPPALASPRKNTGLDRRADGDARQPPIPVFVDQLSCPFELYARSPSSPPHVLDGWSVFEVSTSFALQPIIPAKPAQ